MSISAREAEGDLGAVLQDFEAVGMVPASNSGIHTYGPGLMAKIRHMLDAGHGHHFGQHGNRAVTSLLQAYYSILERNVALVRERRAWHSRPNVVLSVAWDNLAAATTSSIAKVGAPYSGIPFMLLGILVPAELTPRARLTRIAFAGINFAEPSSNTTSVQYSTISPSLGTPAVTGMDVTAFYSNLTAPDGRRGWEAWTSWIFDPAAQFELQWYNPDGVSARSLDLALLMRSSPCDQNLYQAIHQSQHERSGDFQTLMDHIHAGVIGIGAGSRLPHISGGWNSMSGGHSHISQAFHPANRG